MIIGVDLDDVLGDFISPYIKFHNKNYGTNWTKEQMHSYSFEKITGESFDVVKKKIFDFYETEDFKRMKPIDGAKEALEDLKRDHKLIVITGRPNFISETTLKWVNKNYSGIFSEILSTDVFIDKKDEARKEKSHYCVEHGVSVMIDDQFNFVEDCTNKNIKVLLYDSPWNRDIKTNELLIRVKSWYEIFSKIEGQ